MTEIDEFSFEPDTGSYLSCSFVLNGIMFIVGGYSNRDFTRQISIVESCRINKVGQLPYDFYDGACNSYTNEVGNESALLCFSLHDKYGCLT